MSMEQSEGSNRTPIGGVYLDIRTDKKDLLNPGRVSEYVCLSVRFADEDTKDLTVREAWDEGECPFDEDTPMEEVVQAIIDRVNWYLYTSRKSERLEACQWLMDNILEVEAVYCETRARTLDLQIESLTKKRDSLRRNAGHCREEMLATAKKEGQQ